MQGDEAIWEAGGGSDILIQLAPAYEPLPDGEEWFYWYQIFKKEQ